MKEKKWKLRSEKGMGKYFLYFYSANISEDVLNLGFGIISREVNEIFQAIKIIQRGGGVEVI